MKKQIRKYCKNNENSLFNTPYFLINYICKYDYNKKISKPIKVPYTGGFTIMMIMNKQINTGGFVSISIFQIKMAR